MADGFWSFRTPRCSCNANSRHAVKHDGIPEIRSKQPSGFILSNARLLDVV
jgi:hypothetical protein